MDTTEITEYERVESSYARQHLSELLDAVLTGKTYTITRHGRAIAQLVPVSAPAQAPSHSSGQGKLMDKIKRHDDIGNSAGPFRGSVSEEDDTGGTAF
jgi:prevent-host-death family protein